MPLSPPRPPQLTVAHGLEELWRAYSVYHGTFLHDLVGALQEHFKDVCPDRGFIVTLPLHGATNFCVRQLLALLNPGQRTPDNLNDVWIWLFNQHQPDEEQIWVQHLAWAHTLIAPPNKPQPAPSPGS